MILLWTPDSVVQVGVSDKLQGSTLTFVRSTETTIKTYGRVSKIPNSFGRRVRFKAQIFFFNFSPVNVPVFWMFTNHSAIPYCSKQKINILLTSFRCTYDNLYGTLRSKVFAGSIFCQDRWRTKAICKQEDLLFGRTWVSQNVALLWQSVVTTAEQKRWVLVVNTNKSNESEHFYHRGSETGLGLSTWMLNPDKLQHQQLSTARCIARYVKRNQK